MTKLLEKILQLLHQCNNPKKKPTKPLEKIPQPKNQLRLTIQIKQKIIQQYHAVLASRLYLGIHAVRLVLPYQILYC